MSVNPNHGSGSTREERLVEGFNDLRRRIRALEAERGDTPGPDSIEGEAIAPNSIDTEHITSGAVTADEIEAGSINSQHIVADAIDAGHIAAGSITATEIQAGSLTAGTIAAGAITTDKLAANSVTAAKIAAGQIEASHIKAGNVEASHIKAGAIAAGHISADSIQTIHIGAQQVTAAKILAGTITADQIAADTITANEIAAGTITANEIAAGTITATQIAANSITATQIAANTITATQIAANTITADEIATMQLSAISSDMGNITAGTITGALVRTASSGARAEMDSLGFRGYTAGGVKTFEISTGTGTFISADPQSIISGPALSAADFGTNNIVPNSSFEQGLKPTDPTANPLLNAAEGWEISGGTGTGYGPSTEQAYDGTVSYKQISGGGNIWIGRRATSSIRVPVKRDRKYTISFWVYNAAATARKARIFYYFCDASTSGFNTAAGGNVLSSVAGVNVNGVPTSYSTSGGPDNLLPGVWSRVTLTTTAAPATVRDMGFLVHFDATTTGDIFYTDAVQVEQGDVVSAYKPRGDEVLYGQIKSLFIGAGEVAANNIKAGAITTEHLTVASPSGTVNIKNGLFNQGATGTYAVGSTAITDWVIDTGSTSWTILADPYGVFPRVARIAPAGTFTGLYQDIKLPKGRHIISAFGRGQGGDATLALSVTSGTATVTAATPSTTDAWAHMQGAVDITSSEATIRVRIQSAQASGYAYFANVNVMSTMGPTVITPNSLTTNQITAGGIHADRIQSSTITATQIAANTITANEIAANTITANQIAAGTITATQIGAGAITADKVSFRVGGRNQLLNSGFARWIPADPNPPTIPTDWTPYDNGGAPTPVYSKVTNGFLTGVDSWRMTTNAQATVQKGFRTLVVQTIRPNVDYVVSCWWKGNVRPVIASNNHAAGYPVALLSPTPSTTTWQRYAWRVRHTGNDYVFFGTDYGAATTLDVQIARVQFEEGDTISEWTQYINPTVIDGDSIYSAYIDGATIQGATIRTGPTTGNRLELTSSGLRAMNSTGQAMMTLSPTNFEFSQYAPSALRPITYYDASGQSGIIFQQNAMGGTKNGTSLRAQGTATTNWSVASVLAQHNDGTQTQIVMDTQLGAYLQRGSDTWWLAAADGSATYARPSQAIQVYDNIGINSGGHGQDTCAWWLNVPAGGRYAIIVGSQTCYAAVGATAGFLMYAGSSYLGQAKLYFNAVQHQRMTVTWMGWLGAGSHYLKLQNWYATTDVNDYASMSVLLL